MLRRLSHANYIIEKLHYFLSITYTCRTNIEGISFLRSLYSKCATRLFVPVKKLLHAANGFPLE